MYTQFKRNHAYTAPNITPHIFYNGNPNINDINNLIDKYLMQMDYNIKRQDCNLEWKISFITELIMHLKNIHRDACKKMKLTRH